MSDAHRISGSRGFSLIELLIVVTIIGLVAAIAVPNLLNAMHRSRQSRTLADTRVLGEAVEMYQQDWSAYPIAPADSVAEVLRPFVSFYVGHFSADDGWKQPLRYTSDGAHYTVVSYGANAVADTPYTQGPTHLFDADIVFPDGTFLQWPQGTQR
jgi:general secretion pathway protein G